MIARLLIAAALIAQPSPTTGDGWCGDDTTCQLVFGAEEN
jgi:hypothetical protein